MNIFGNLMARIFGHGEAAAGPVPATSTASAVAAAPAVSTVVVDVEAVLEAMAAKNPEKLNWRTSMVDLMKLVGMDSSLGPAEGAGDGARLHGQPAGQRHHEHLAAQAGAPEAGHNGGKIPASLLN